MIRQVVVGLIALLAAGCGEGPTRPAPEPDIARQEEPFYYYQDSRVYLGVDSTKIVISADSVTATSVGSVLDNAGVQVVSLAGLEIAPEHWVVGLAPGTSRADAEHAAEVLRLTTGIDFASIAYNSLGTCRSMLVINEFVVTFEATASDADIRDLNRKVGAAILRQTQWNDNAYVLAFPRRSAYTPLEIAAYYKERPVVEHSAPDFVVGWSPGP